MKGETELKNKEFLILKKNALNIMEKYFKRGFTKICKDSLSYQKNWDNIYWDKEFRLGVEDANRSKGKTKNISTKKRTWMLSAVRSKNEKAK